MSSNLAGSAIYDVNRWTDWDWKRWLFHVSPHAVSLQFAIGVAAHRPSLLSLPARLNAVVRNLGRSVLRDRFDVATLTSLSTALLMVRPYPTAS